jgi:hypothetical protein
MKLITITGKGNTVESGATKVAKELLEGCRNGKYTDFIAVAVEKNNNTSAFIGSSGEKTMLEMLGAFHMLSHCVYEILDED